MTKIFKLLIIGAGPSGYTAAIYASRLNLKPIIITGINDGGQIINSNNIENWPGSYKKINGYKLMENMKKQALKFNTKIINDEIIKINFKKKPFKIFGKLNIYLSKSIIIATGCKPKMLGLNIEKKLYGKNISTCTNCDGFFYKNKIVAVVGGGNHAAEECLILCKFTKKIFLIHRNNKLKIDNILYKKIKKKIKKKKIVFLKNFIIKNIKKIKNLILIKKKKKKLFFLKTLLLKI